MMVPVIDLLKRSKLSGDTIVIFVDEYQQRIARGHLRGIRKAALCPELCRDCTLLALLGLYAVADRYEVNGPYGIYTITIGGAW